MPQRREPTSPPRPLTSLIGRARELRDLAEALPGVRLLTLTGPGGVGKTRLALEVAEAERPRQQVYYVDLTSVNGPGSPAGVTAGICQAAGLPGVPRSQGLGWLATALAGPPALLVLDNAEHVIRACAEVVDALLRLCPALQVLVTSREPLGVEGESVYRVGPLPVADEVVADIQRDAPDARPGAAGPQPSAANRQPDATGDGAGDNHATGDGAVPNDAVALFVDRLRSIDASFDLTEANRADVAAICRAMAGLPLGIELAAARAAAIGVDRVAEVVVCATHADGQGHPARHHSVTASLGWSYDLLPADEAAVFRRLSVFPASFDATAAAAVAGEPILKDETVPATRSVLPQLARLVDKSMVIEADRDGETWYRMLAPLRTYAATRLAESGESGRVLTAYLGYVTALAASLGASPDTPESSADLDRLEGALPDIRAALDLARQAESVLTGTASVPSAADTDDLDPAEAALRVALGVRLAGSLLRMCYLRGHYQEGQQWMEWAVAAGRGGPQEALATALQGAGRLAFLRCDYPLATARLREALTVVTMLGDRPRTIDTLMWLGSVARETSDYPTAESLCRQARALAVEAGDEWSTVRADNYLAFTAWLQCRFDEAIDLCRATEEAAERIGDADTVFWSVMNRGAACLYRGDLELAGALLRDAMIRADRDRFAEGIAWSRHLLGVLRVRVGDLLGALPLLRSALAAHLALDDRWRLTSVLDDLAGLAATAADGSTAARFLGAADELRRQIGVSPAPAEQPDRQTTVRVARGLLRGKDFDAELALGAAADVEELFRALGPVPLPPRPAADAPVVPTGGGGVRARPGGGDAAGRLPSALPSLDIRMLGTAAVRVDGRLLRGTDFGYAKPRELLFLLAARGRSTREQIGEALWPDAPDAKVRGALHTALRELRRALASPGMVAFTGGEYLLCPDADITSDLADFERACAAAETERNVRDLVPLLREAIEIYGGDFLGGGPQPAWAEDIARGLRSRYHALLLRLGSTLTRQGRWASATEAFLRAVAHDPQDRQARRLLAAAWSGEPVEGGPADAATASAGTEPCGGEVGSEVGGETDGTFGGEMDSMFDSESGNGPQWLIELAKTSSPFGVTTGTGSSLLYRELVQRRRSRRTAHPSRASAVPGS